MRLKILLIALLGCSLNTLAQENLVKNPSFEEIEKKVKEGGQIEMATGWTSPTDAKADLYSSNAKADLYLTKEMNAYGIQDPEDGEAYAGIRTYAYKDAKPNTYLMQELKSPLKAGEEYCVKINLSMADLSKYGVNNIGVYLSKEPVTQKAIDKGIEPQVMHSSNRVFKEAQIWESMCRKFVAEGGEKYITIGNFKKSTETTFEQVKRPRGVTKPQVRESYFYIDNVSVKSTKGLGKYDCMCEKNAIGGGQMQTIHHQDISAKTLEDAGEMSSKVIYFEEKSHDLNDAAIKTINELVELHKKHPDYIITIIGHTDSKEQMTSQEVNLSKHRAKAVYDIMVKKGIMADKLVFKGYADTKPDSKTDAAKNRRVTFKVGK